MSAEEDNDSQTRPKDPPRQRGPGVAIRDYLELLRLSNVFTAMADVAMGFLFVRPVTGRADAWTLGLLIAASSLLYVAGVVLNDVFDLEIDRRERPDRPIPSGRVSLGAARRLGWNLLLLGVVVGIGAGFVLGHARPGIVAVLLATAILLYDAWLKQMWVGPVGMGACRTLNVMLGMSAAALPMAADQWLVAGGVGTYIAGVTWFARGETERSNRLHLVMATMVMMLGVALLGWFPSLSRNTIPLLQQQPQRWPLAMTVFGILIAWRCLWAAVEPSPTRVRMAVTQSIFSLVILDAAVCYAIRDVSCAIMILLLLVPTMLLGRWIEAT